jgi:hypothetical protein
MTGMDCYSKAAMERAMKVQEVIFTGPGEEDYLVAGGRDYRHQRSVDAALARALRRARL